MSETLKKIIVSVIGFILLFIGIIFIILPGPAVLFIPAGLALLSTQYDWAKVWLKKSQCYFRQAANKADQMTGFIKRKFAR